MEYKVIKTDNYLFAIDDKDFNAGSKVLHKESIYTVKEDTGSYLKVEEFSHIGIRKDLCKKILSHRPLNGAPYLDGVDVLPSLPQEDDVDSICIKDLQDFFGTDIHLTPKGEEYISIFKTVYNKCREKYKFTEEDVFGFLTYYNSINFNKPEYRYKHPTMDGSEREYNRSIDRKIFEEYIQSLHQPKLPIAFECEKYLCFPSHCFRDCEIVCKYPRPRTITNSEGRTEWVGKYIYE